MNVDETMQYRPVQTVGSVPMAPPVVAAPVQHKHHWSVYLVVASACLLVAGLASDPKVVETLRSILALR